MSEKKYAIRFGLGAVKAVGFNAMEKCAAERKENGEYKDVFDFARRMDAKLVNKKSIEALAKCGAFDKIADNRRQIFESYDIISSYAIQQEAEANSNQMNFLGELISAEKSIPALKKVPDWNKEERLTKEFEAFGYFLKEHPLDDEIDNLKRRGVVFSTKIEKDEFEDSSIVKMAGVIATSKHRSGPKGRFAYVTISDPFGFYEIMIFDEALITNHRDDLEDGSKIVFEGMVRKDDGGIRVMMREVYSLESFLKNAEAKEEFFEDIKILPKRKFKPKNNDDKNGGAGNSSNSAGANFGANLVDEKDILEQMTVEIQGRDTIFNLKSFLSRKKASEHNKKITKVFVVASGKKIQLPENYILTEKDGNKLKKGTGVVGVEW